MARKQRQKPPASGGMGVLPGRDEILSFIAAAQEKVGKREIAKAFGIKGGQRIHLKRLLAEMTADGTLRGDKKRLSGRASLAGVTIIEIVARDGDGDLVGEPAVWDDDGERPRVLIVASGQPQSNPVGIGDRVLARVTALEEPDVAGYRFEAAVIKALPRDKRRQVGIFRAHARGGGEIAPVSRKELRTYAVAPRDSAEAKDGDLVRFDLASGGQRGVPQARVTGVLGNPQDQRQISLIAVHAHGLPDQFPDAVMAEVDELETALGAGRTDLRQLPLLTIDPADARDHDDAVHAAPDPNSGNPGGFIVTVAIADVAHYVRFASRLDREAALRGNSVYFPDRVVPMLPERLSNDLCSLKEHEDRPCLAVRLVFDRRGEKKGHTFLRAVMRSAAKLSYQEAQAAFDKAPSPRCKPLMKSSLQPLLDAYRAVAAARDRRAPLDLELPERKLLLDAEGRVERVVTPERLTAHRLIEEFMIQANVAAAEALEARRTPVVYRVHEPPSPEKLAALRQFLESLDLQLPGAATLKPAHFNRVLADAKRLPVPDLVNEVVLRSQSQAEYAIVNGGHFGLHLQRYAHFTSPIRRYADLIVHRALIRALRLGGGGLQDEEIPQLASTAKSISDAERRGMAAERETVDRLIAAHLADRIGAEFDARIAGVTRSGLFVRLKETGADGFVPISTLGREFYHHVEERHALVGARSGLAYRLGDEVRVKLVEAIPSAGALRFEMLSEGKPDKGATLAARRGVRTPRSRRPRR